MPLLPGRAPLAGEGAATGQLMRDFRRHRFGGLAFLAIGALFYSSLSMPAIVRHPVCLPPVHPQHPELYPLDSRIIANSGCLRGSCTAGTRAGNRGEHEDDCRATGQDSGGRG
jgi:hypothetical protein